MRPFHLAFPVTDLDQTERFYVDMLGCAIGRRTEHTINFNFHGHQIVCLRLDTLTTPTCTTALIDLSSCPPPPRACHNRPSDDLKRRSHPMVFYVCLRIE